MTLSLVVDCSSISSETFWFSGMKLGSELSMMHPGKLSFESHFRKTFFNQVGGEY